MQYFINTLFPAVAFVGWQTRYCLGNRVGAPGYQV
jgi:hypothetical protein